MSLSSSELTNQSLNGANFNKEIFHFKAPDKSKTFPFMFFFQRKGARGALNEKFKRYFTFSLMNVLVYVNINQGIYRGESKTAQNEK